MKKLFTLVSLIALSYFAQARILTVSNVAGQAAMFKVVQTAVDSAQVGDTVFVHASATDYASISIKKRIVLLGEGGRPDWSSLKVRINNYIYVDSIAQVPGAGTIPVSGTVINGIHTDYVSIMNSVKGLIVKNCFIGGNINTTGSGHIFVNNYIGWYINGASTNVLCMNNFFAKLSGEVNIADVTNWTISNNIFSGAFSGTSCTVVNNIFLGANAIGSTNTSNSFSKNLQVGTDLPIGNYTGQALFTTFTETISASMPTNEFVTKKFTFKAGSPGIAGGTDGKDVGIRGGQYPWPAGKFLNGDPGLPKVQSIEVQNAVLAPGATLKVNLKAKSASTKQ